MFSVKFCFTLFNIKIPFKLENNYVIFFYKSLMNNKENEYASQTFAMQKNKVKHDDILNFIINIKYSLY